MTFANPMVQLETQTGKISLRPVTPEDESLLFAIYCSGRAQEMAGVPWTDDQKEAFLRLQFNSQTNYYRDYYSGSEHSIVLFNDIEVGRVQVVEDEGQLHILDITILTEYRGQGIGTPIIKKIMDRGATSNLPVIIYVETFSPSASLFRRLGFIVKEDDNVNFLFEWKKL
jgi:RimJ/RimL family protein N-acetyltransferase